MANQKFSVNLEGFELNRAQVSALKIIKDPNWLGIWLRKFGSIGNLKESKTFKQVKLR